MTSKSDWRISRTCAALAPEGMVRTLSGFARGKREPVVVACAGGPEDRWVVTDRSGQSYPVEAVDAAGLPLRVAVLPAGWPSADWRPTARPTSNCARARGSGGAPCAGP
ncbi:hypothetical protein [Kitasatospora sp. NPDC015120]|uniref:hypothetical protein n=1 Tax=Kitasatospora sp. NPDC015120 TaxID=3364023 RepID=UPI0036F4ABA8